MKYIIVTQTYPPRIGGMQNVMASISERLAFIEDTHVFPDHFLSKKCNYSNSQLQIHNNFSPKLLRPFIKKYLIDKVYKDNDVIICDSWKSINAVPSRIKKIFVLAHGQEFLSTNKKFGLIKKSLDRANCIICSSNYTENLIREFKVTDTKKIVIPPTYSIEIPTKSRTKLKKKSKLVSLLTISRLEERKGIIPVLKSLSELNKNKFLKPFLWNICGEGPQTNEIKKCIKSFGLSEQVKLIGKISRHDKFDFIQNCDLFVMPSYKVKNSIEGFGISYIEAAAYGIPSIAGIEGGVVDAVANSRTGWCIDPLSLKELADTLKDAINNEKKREEYGLQAQKQFVDYFSGEKVFRKLMDTISI